MRVLVHWSRISGDDDEAWSYTRVLYAYCRTDMREVLYVGKADGAYSSVRSRFNAADKSGGFWNGLRRERGLTAAAVLVGEIELVEAARLSRQLLADIESLLIAETQPWGNIQCRDRRISRPGLVVHSRGRWPGPRIIHDV